MEAPSAEDLGPLLESGSEALDAPAPDPLADQDGEYMAAATAAVGDERRAVALQDAIESVLRKHGLLSVEPAADEALEEDAELEGDVGAGFPDL